MTERQFGTLGLSLISLGLLSFLVTIVMIDQHRRLVASELQLVIYKTSYGAMKDATTQKYLSFTYP
jgi:hypothetical protein